MIPNGIPGHFNPVAQVPAGTYPFYVDRAKGSRFWDVDGNEYIDYLCAYGPMILGYDNEVIEQAVREQLAKADTCTLASPVMVDLAELFVDLIPGRIGRLLRRTAQTRPTWRSSLHARTRAVEN